jgi:hypothetical protein
MVGDVPVAVRTVLVPYDRSNDVPVRPYDCTTVPYLIPHLDPLLFVRSITLTDMTSTVRPIIHSSRQREVGRSTGLSVVRSIREKTQNHELPHARDAKREFEIAMNDPSKSSRPMTAKFQAPSPRLCIMTNPGI